MAVMIDILVVEDDDAIRYLCEAILKKNHAYITCVASLHEALIALEKTHFNLLIIDLNLPDGDGLDLVKQFSIDSTTPILIMTGRGTPLQRFEGLEAGAADYLIKPFHPGELLHRVETLLASKLAHKAPDKNQFQLGEWMLNRSSRTLSNTAGNTIDITQGEFDLLVALACAQGHVVSRNKLLDAITLGEGNGHPRTVDVLISRLRKKLEPTPRQPRYIITVPKLGYRLNLAVA